MQPAGPIGRVGILVLNREAGNAPWRPVAAGPPVRPGDILWVKVSSDELAYFHLLEVYPGDIVAPLYPVGSSDDPHLYPGRSRDILVAVDRPVRELILYATAAEIPLSEVQARLGVQLAAAGEVPKKEPPPKPEERKKEGPKKDEAARPEPVNPLTRGEEERYILRADFFLSRGAVVRHPLR